MAAWNCQYSHPCRSLKPQCRRWRHHAVYPSKSPPSLCIRACASAVNAPCKVDEEPAKPLPSSRAAVEESSNLRKPSPSAVEAPSTSKAPPPKFNDSKHSSIDIYNSLSVSVAGDGVAAAIKSFNAYRFRSRVLRNNLKSQHVEKPSIVQQHVLPIIQAGKDVVVCSPPGTGKTLAFLIPIMQQLMRRTRATTKNFAYPQAIILCTSWEHCMQVQETCKQLATGSHLKIVSLHGGIPMVDQILRLRGGCDVVVATVGRLLDHVDRGRVKLANLKMLVMDNAEQLLSAGSQLDLRRILYSRSMPPADARQTLAFSSSLSPGHLLILNELMNNPVVVEVGSASAAPPHLSQQVVQLEQGQKFEKLLEHLKLRKELAIVFCRTRSRVEDVYSFLLERDVKCCSIHRDHTQIERENSWQSFKYGVAPVLVTTSIAARGLDIPEVDLVINFDLPKGLPDYLCRVGRTGRAGRPGVAISYFSRNEDGRLAADLVESLGQSGQPVPRWLENQAHAFQQLRGAAARDGDPAAVESHTPNSSSGNAEAQQGVQLRRIGRNPPEFGSYLDKSASQVSGTITEADTQSLLDALSRVETSNFRGSGTTVVDQASSSPSSWGQETAVGETARVQSSWREQGSMTLGPGVREGKVSIPREKIRKWQQLAQLGVVAWPKSRRNMRRQRQGYKQQSGHFSSLEGVPADNS